MFGIKDVTESLDRLKKVVRAYDVRGVVPEELNERDAFIFGAVLGKHFSGCHVILAMDNRQTSFNLSNALVAGFNSCHMVVQHLGVLPTPVLYYESFLNGFNTLGVMVTASHNPPQYNGFKIVFNSRIVDGNSLVKIIDQHSHYNSSSQKQYINYLLEKTNLNSISNPRLKILWDCNHGATQEMIKQLVQELPNRNTVINTDQYITSTPDPVSNIERIRQIVCNYDIAFCFDGDGDRLLVITQEGSVLRGDKILLILAEYLAHPSVDLAAVVDIKTSNLVIQKLQNLGFTVHVQKTGHSFIKQMMLEKNALIGGEISGHLFFRLENAKSNYTIYDDALLAACYFLKILFDQKELLRRSITRIDRTICEYDLKVYCERRQQKKIIDHLVSALQAKQASFIDIDGVKYEEDDGWWLVRPSNTEDALIVCIEGLTSQAFEQRWCYIQNILALENLQLPSTKQPRP